MQSLIALRLLVSACTAAADRAAPDHEADKTAIRSIIKEAVAAHHAGDAQRWAGLFTSEGLLLPEGAPTVAGTDSLQGWARRFFDTYESAYPGPGERLSPLRPLWRDQLVGLRDAIGEGVVGTGSQLCDHAHALQLSIVLFTWA